MRRIWLAGCSVAVLCFVTECYAYSQGMPVIDEASIIGRGLEHVETIAKWGYQAQQMEYQLQRLMATYQALTGVRDLGSAMSALSLAGVQNPLPVNPWAVQNLISGAGGVQGVPGALAGLYNGNASANHVYASEAGDWQAQQMAQNANSLAGIQSISQRSYQAASERLQMLSGLRARMATASDPAEVSQLRASTAVVQADIASLTQQQASIAQMAQTQSAVRVQRDDEHERQCLDKLVSYFRRVSNDASCPVQPVGASVFNIASTGNGFSSPAGGSGALDTMLAQPWGEQAAQNATTLGVNPTALAGTCVLESGCSTNVSGTGTVSGAFQMTNGTFQNAATSAGISPNLANKNNPGIQSIAAAQELKTAALTLQQSGIASPTVLDVRGAYNYGQAYGVALARADGSTPMASVLSTYSADTLAKNGITPGLTVGQWRSSVSGRLGDAASQPVLLGLLPA